MTFITYDSADSGNQNPEDDTLWGWDDFELVGVGLSPREELREIRIDPSWKSKIPAENLASAVLTAYMGAIMLRVTEYPGAVGGATDPAAPASPSNGAEIPVIESSLMEQVDRERDDYLAAYSEALGAENPYVSADGNVTVTTRGGSPISIVFDSAWMGFAEARHIVASTTEALGRAIESGRSIDEQIRAQFPAIAEFRRLRAIKKAARGF